MSHHLTRRSFTAAALAGVASTQWSATAAPQPPRTRHSATSVEGKKNLVKYAKAVDLMNNQIPKGDPRHWEFQWYTHWIPGPGDPWSAVVARKQQVLNDVYAGKPPNDPNRVLAQAMWDTCQAHAQNPNDPNFFQERFFLPWHRHYVFFFEEIIRAVLQDNTFTLPYWDYLSGNVSDLSLPPEFLNTASPLYRANRNSWVNNGERIDKQNPNSINLKAFDELAYINAGGFGFCPMMDGNPHGQIHVKIGTATNMGDVPTAAGDPIFWLHHCNIDRLWESWNRLPNRKNPTWPNRSFTFAKSDGKPASVKAAAADRVSLLKYQYDKYYVPANIPPLVVMNNNPVATTTSLAAATATTRAAATEAVSLDTDRVKIALAPSLDVPPPVVGANTPLAAPPPVNRRLYLVLGGIQVNSPTLSTYNVYVNVPEGRSPTGTDDPNYVGTFSLFGAAGHQHGAGAAGHRVAFNVTGLQALQTGTPPNITFVRRGGDDDGARPTVAQVLLVES